jgi:hypothetical protein
LGVNLLPQEDRCGFLISGVLRMPKDIKVEIAAGEAILFLENNSGLISVDRFEQYLKKTGSNVYLIAYVLLSENLISIIRHDNGQTVVKLNGLTSMTKMGL